MHIFFMQGFRRSDFMHILVGVFIAANNNYYLLIQKRRPMVNWRRT